MVFHKKSNDPDVGNDDIGQMVSEYFNEMEVSNVVLDVNSQLVLNQRKNAT